jgi:hypothetical protein
MVFARVVRDTGHVEAAVRVEIANTHESVGIRTYRSTSWRLECPAAISEQNVDNPVPAVHVGRMT